MHLFVVQCLVSIRVRSIQSILLYYVYSKSILRIFFPKNPMLKKLFIKKPAVIHEPSQEKFVNLSSFPEYNPNPLIQLDSSGVVQYMNLTAKHLFPDMESLQMQHPFLQGLEKFFQKTPKNYLNIITREVFVNGCFYTQTLTKVPNTTTYRLFGTDITELKKVEQILLDNIKFMKSLDEVNLVMQGSKNLEQIMSDVLDATLAIFDCDRAWLLYPSSPKSTSYQVPMERTKVEYPGAHVRGMTIPIDSESLRVFQAAEASTSPVTFDAESKPPLPTAIAKNFGVQSQMVINIYPKVGGAYMFGMHQCSYKRVWTAEEKRLFQEIGRRLADGLTSLLFFRNLQKKEEEYRRLIETSNEGVWVIDQDHKTTFANARMLTMLGYTEKELIGKKPEEITVPEEIEDHMHEMQERRKGKTSIYERRFIRKDGSVIWVKSSATPIFDEKKQFVGSFAMMTDITERKKTELEREQFFKFFNLSTDIMVIADPNGAFKKVNPTCVNELGYSVTELLSKSFIDFVHPDDKQSTLDEMARQIKTGSSLNFENRYVCKDGKILWLSWRANYNKEEGITYATARDITERKIAEIELIHVNRALRMVSDINQALIRVADEKTLLNETCRIAAEEGGYRLAWVGFAEQENEKIVHIVAQAGSGVEYLKTLRITWADEERGHGPTGTAIRTGKTQASNDIANDPNMLPWRKNALKNGLKSSIALPLKNEGQTFGALTIYAGEINAFNEKEIKILEELAGDLAFGIIAHRIRAERELANTELVRVNRALRMLNENNQALIRITDEKALLDKVSKVVVDSGGYRLMWIGFAEQDEAKTVRPVAQAGFGTDYLKFVNVTWADDEHGRGPTGVAIRTGKTQIAQDILQDSNMSPWRKAAVERGYKSSIALPLKSGEQIFGALNIYSGEANSFGVKEVQILEELADDLAFGIATLRLRKNIEERTKEVNQLKNNFIQIVSHQLRTPLTVIRWNLGAILERQRGDVVPSQEEALRGAYAANLQIIERIDDLLAAIDIEEGRIRLETDKINITELFSSVCEEKLQASLLKNITYEILMPKKSIPEIEIDAMKIRDVIVRLIDNAITYSSVGGHIVVKLFAKDHKVRFEISDTGIGIPETEQTHIFERFHRGWNAAQMKPDASGLSLFIAKHYLDIHNGTIGFSSIEKKGSTFWFELPIV